MRRPAGGVRSPEGETGRAWGTKLAVETQAPSPWLVVDPLAAAPLPPTARQRRWERARGLALAAIPLGVVALGLAVRLWALDLAPFGEPQAAELSAARRLATPSDWAQPTGFLVALHAALLTFSDRVELWLAIRALMDAAAVWLVYEIGRGLSGRLVGAGAAGIFALSPASWLATRDLAVHSAPLLLAVAVWLGVRLLREGGSLWAIPLAVVAGALGRVEPGHVAFGLPLVACVALSHPRTLVGMVVGLVYGVLVATPATQLFARTPSWVGGELATIEAGVATVGGAGEALAGAPLPVSALAWTASLCWLIALTVGIGVLVRGWTKEHGWLIPLLWGIAPLVGLLATGRPLEHVAMTSVPAAALAAGLALAAPAGGWWKLARRVSASAVIVLVATQGILVARLALDASNAGTAAMAPLRYWTVISREVVEAAERTGSTELLVLSVDGPFAGGAEVLGSVLGDRLTLRPITPDEVPLPLERDALYLLLPGASESSALIRPSARYAAVEIPGATEPVRLVGLRPRPAEQWLVEGGDARVVRFADGAFVLDRALP